MTAFARVRDIKKKNGWTVEIRSLNHRFFEFALKAPQDLYPLEDRIRELLHSQISRGKISVNISLGDSEEETKLLTLDEAAAEKYLRAAERLRKKFRLEGEIMLGDLVRFPGILSAEKVEELPEKKWRHLQGLLRKALARTLQMKEREGKRLARDMASRLRKIGHTVERIEKSVAGQSQYYFEKLKKRMGELLRESGSEDKDRIYREAAFLAERSDITEEIVRMKSHLALFERRLRGKAEVGRELDFLCQEMHREVNTMSAKAQLFEVSQDVVLIKGELEKIREQIQNIE
jgi:uncharacterized protein (TIGR00255 family)